MEFTSDHCANCDAPLPDDLSHRPVLFCSTGCAQLAESIRYRRKLRNEGREDDTEAMYGFRMKFLQALAGGYRNIRTRPEVRQAVIERAAGSCEMCGAPGAEVDHIDGPSPEPENLQLLCLDCHHAKTEARLRPASAEERAHIEHIFATRVMPAEPARLCDSSEWVASWRGLRRERAARLRARGIAGSLRTVQKGAKPHQRSTPLTQPVPPPPRRPESSRTMRPLDFYPARNGKGMLHATVRDGRGAYPHERATAGETASCRRTLLLDTTAEAVTIPAGTLVQDAAGMLKVCQRCLVSAERERTESSIGRARLHLAVDIACRPRKGTPHIVYQDAPQKRRPEGRNPLQPLCGVPFLVENGPVTTFAAGTTIDVLDRRRVCGNCVASAGGWPS
ncbi:HNH endonuclease [Streptomyces yunnanensis]|uniref:HNH endonuclease n=1 Tax=Streptomyces yunnanensis TaxID=156453 RepID=A0ABY8A3P7_9ACTN|nr:HNH endonuclease signature motif containing protein [Streptomyces yunnanensis]WEB39577.1 HNH endonuclease [Streptomyces yunnanensis]